MKELPSESSYPKKDASQLLPGQSPVYAIEDKKVATIYARTSEMENLQSDTQAKFQENQNVARIVSAHLLIPKADRKAAKVFAKEGLQDVYTPWNKFRIKNGALAYLREQRLNADPAAENKKNRRDRVKETITQPVTRLADKMFRIEPDLSQKKQIDQTREKTLTVARVALEKKKHFGKVERGKILLEAKFTKMSLQEKIDMYREIGYSDEDIAKITGEKVLATVGLNSAFALLSNTLYGTGIGLEEHYALLSSLPQSVTAGTLVGVLGASLGVSALGFRLNNHMIKRWGFSSDTSVTGAFYACNKLVKERTRDTLSVLLPMVYMTVRTSILNAAVVGAVDTRAAIGGAIAGTVTNLGLLALLGVGYQTAKIREKRKAAKLREEGELTPQPTEEFEQLRGVKTLQ